MAEQRQFVNPAHFNWLGPGYNAEALGGGKYKVTSERYLPEPVVVDTKSGSFSSIAVRKKFGEQAIRARKLEDFRAGLDPEVDAPTGAQFKAAGLDPENRARYYAKEMGISEDKLRHHEGRFGYVDEQGAFKAFEGSRTLNLGTGALPLAAEIAGGTGGAIVGGSVGGPVGAVLAGAGGAGLGAAAAMETSEWLTGEQMESGDKVGRIAMASAFEGGGAAIGALLRKLGPLAFRVDMDAVAKKYGDKLAKGMDDVKAQDEIVREVNERLGMDASITPLERAGATEKLSVSAQADQDQLGRMLETQDETGALYAKRARELEGKTDKAFGRIFPRATGAAPRKAGTQIVDLARQAIASGDEVLKKQSQELYSEAFLNSPYVKTETFDQVIGMLDADPNTRAFAKKLTEEMTRIKHKIGDDTFDFAELEPLHNNIMGMLSTQIPKAMTSAGMKSTRETAVLVKAQKELSTYLKSISPEYSDATAMWKAMNDQKRNAYVALKDIAKLSPAMYAKVGKKIFQGGLDLDDIGRARKFINSQPGGRRVWDGMVMAHLKTLRTDAMKRTRAGTKFAGRGAVDVGAPGKLGNSILMSKQLKAGMEGGQYADLEKVASVLDRWGKSAAITAAEAQQRGSMAGFVQVVTRPMHDKYYKKFWQAIDAIDANPDLLQTLPQINFQRKTLTGEIQTVRRWISAVLGEELDERGDTKKAVTRSRAQLRRAQQGIQRGVQGLLGEE